MTADLASNISAPAAAPVLVQTEFVDPAGKLPARVRVTCDIETQPGDSLWVSILWHGGTVVDGWGADVALEIPEPRLWSDATPDLYECHVLVTRGASVVGEKSVRFGIRTVGLDAVGDSAAKDGAAKGASAKGADGLLVNGAPVKLRVSNVPATCGNDLLRRLRELGFNAVRVLPADGFGSDDSDACGLADERLDLCDELGLYVIDSASGDDDALVAMVQKDRNHPCVIMYALASEGPAAEGSADEAAQAEQAAADELARRVGVLKELDASRPVTAIRVSLADGAPSEEAADAEPEVEAEPEIDADAEPATELESEAVAGDAKSANAVAERVASGAAALLAKAKGLGERLGSVKSTSLPVVRAGSKVDVFQALDVRPLEFGRAWAMGVELGKSAAGCPSLVEVTSAADLVAAWRRAEQQDSCVGVAMGLAGGISDELVAVVRALWLQKEEPSICVRPAGKLPAAIALPWLAGRDSVMVSSWDWPGCEGERMAVSVFTAAPIAKLYVDGRHLATHRVRGCHADFEVAYAAGELVAIACTSSGMELERTVLESAAAK